MNVLLILVSLSQGGDLPPITSEFPSMSECESGALAVISQTDELFEVTQFEDVEEAALLENMKVAWGADGSMLGMFSCAPLARPGG